MDTKVSVRTYVTGRSEFEPEDSVNEYRKMNEQNENRNEHFRRRTRFLSTIGIVFGIITCALVVWAIVKHGKECKSGTYGKDCDSKCGNCKDGSICDKSTGVCPSGCSSGWTTEKCHQTITPPSVLSECRNGWMRNNDSCYLFELKRKSWIHATVECKKYGAHLAELLSPDENNFIKRTVKSLKSGGKGFWIGASDAKVEGVWKWVSSDETLTFDDWSPGEPNNRKNEDCMEIMNDWNDADCNSQFNYICQQDNDNY